jgi:hypothetical protein
MTMEWREYERLSERTLSSEFHCDQRMQRMLHAVMGMLTEIEEVLDNHSSARVDDVNKAEEWGDIAWYLAILTREYAVSPDDHRGPGDGSSPDTHIMELTKHLLRFLDMFKKSLYYGRKFDDESARSLTLSIIRSALGYASAVGIETGNALRANIEKLRARYGEKFSSESAINRDLENERKILSDNL